MIENFFYTFFILIGFMIVVFVIAEIIDDNSIVDIAYGIGFVIVVISSLIIASHYTIHNIIMTILVTIWGLRLSIYIFKRNNGKKEILI